MVSLSTRIRDHFSRRLKRYRAQDKVSLIGDYGEELVVWRDGYSYEMAHRRTKDDLLRNTDELRIPRGWAERNLKWSSPMQFGFDPCIVPVKVSVADGFQNRPLMDWRTDIFNPKLEEELDRTKGYSGRVSEIVLALRYIQDRLGPCITLPSVRLGAAESNEFYDSLIYVGPVKFRDGGPLGDKNYGYYIRRTQSMPERFFPGPIAPEEGQNVSAFYHTLFRAYLLDKMDSTPSISTVEDGLRFEERYPGCRGLVFPDGTFVKIDPTKFHTVTCYRMTLLSRYLRKIGIHIDPKCETGYTPDGFYSETEQEIIDLYLQGGPHKLSRRYFTIMAEGLKRDVLLNGRVSRFDEFYAPHKAP